LDRDVILTDNLFSFHLNHFFVMAGSMAPAAVLVVCELGSMHYSSMCAVNIGFSHDIERRQWKCLLSACRHASHLLDTFIAHQSCTS